jgi:hypothetical protein
MRARIVAAAVSLAAVAGPAAAQLPTAPPPRPALGPVPEVKSLIFRYVGPTGRETPAVEVTARGGRVEVRWEAEGTIYVATAASAVVRDGAVILTGTSTEPAHLLTAGRGPSRERRGSTLTGRRITIRAAEGTVEVDGPGRVETPNGR